MASFDDVMTKATAIPAALDDGSRVTRASDGTPRIARLYGQTIYTFRVTFQCLTSAEWLALLSFYNDNHLDSEIELTDPTSGVEYLVSMTAPPQLEAQYAIYYDASIELIGTRA